MIKFEKYELSVFTGKKINKFGQKAKIFEKNENAHEIRKKTTVLCPGVIGEKKFFSFKFGIPIFKILKS